MLFRLCKISPFDFWKFTPAETSLMIEQAGEQFKFEQEIHSQRHAELLTAVLNAPHFQKKDKKPHEVKEFLPQQKKEKPTVEQYELMLRNSTLALGGKINYQ